MAKNNKQPGLLVLHSHTISDNMTANLSKLTKENTTKKIEQNKKKTASVCGCCQLHKRTGL